MWLNEAPSSRWMDGIAMFTIVTSTRSMKAAVMTIARANQRRRSVGDPAFVGWCPGDVEVLLGEVMP
ncbi:hypothetical protein GCM10012286_41400 [Streptomyces lasiicapitis]|uniref:Uncharacterized protein n=1 Tax=Streptomyces lasiicapitis TaxID=1923961 RepID=A0ABQ2M6P7_9ACTN|nr:hypothetical protein GCM10012286_41400 [Streptomyces lasiicapitis]